MTLPRDEFLERCRAVQARCAETRLPEPDPTFRALVERELADARHRALQSLPVAVTEYIRVGTRWDPDQVVVARLVSGRCSGCGGDRDERTPGCDTCSSRANWRAWRDRQREAAAA